MPAPQTILNKCLSWFFLLASLIGSDATAQNPAPLNSPEEWQAVGRAKIQFATNSVLIQGGYTVNQWQWQDGQFTFQARTPVGADQVQIWAGFHYRDRDSRYVFALRGGNDNDLYLARYAPDGEIRFLGFAPLDFKPMPGEWYRLRVATLGNRIQIYLNEEKLPRLNVADDTALWTNGSICLGGGWLPAEFTGLEVKPFTEADKAEFLSIGDQRRAPPPVDKEALRKEQRGKYTPVNVAEFAPLRTEIPLNGKWLFLPDYQATGPAPTALELDDRDWHVMDVPEFWAPGLSWLHGETAFKDLPGVSSTKGAADSLVVQENSRVESYTFDWRKTKSAWYREYVELPADLGNRHFELAFDAIAKVSEIWVNGTKVGAHTGMFGEIKCDVTGAVRPGRNLIAVHVIGSEDQQRKDGDKVESVAVTVEVTTSMLHSLPHGMFQDSAAGIWQPVKLTVTAPVLVTDCFIQTGLHKADIDLTISNATGRSESIGVHYLMASVNGNKPLYTSGPDQTLNAVARESGHLRLTTPELNPQLWSPQDPNLYILQVFLTESNRVIDQYSTRFGFRTFTVDGSHLMLNGHPYWLRGANPFPNTLRPNDAELAHRFMQIAREGNVSVTRSHIVPFTTTWLDAADEVGMAVSFEGTWPWLMLRGSPPDKELLKVWKEEFLSLIHEHRNHPSLIMWTVNNEMKFPVVEKDPAALKDKWLILDDMVKAMRQMDPTRPIVADSSYVRREARKSYETVVKPNQLDDGDIDDRHVYYGWYNQTFFHLDNGEFGKESATPGRPLISQEMSTGYPNNDDGHPVRFYLFKNFTPQAFVGDDAYEDADPAIFLSCQAFLTGELAETFRRTERNTASGILHFAYISWFTTPWSAENVKPLPAYYALKNALQPILVSAELYGRHFYAGKSARRRVCVVNDAENFSAIPASRLLWEIKDGENVLSHGETNVPPVDYYANHWLAVDFAMPQVLPRDRVDAQLVLKLEAGVEVLSTNSYDIVVASPAWTNPALDKNSSINVLNPDEKTLKILSGLTVTPVSSLSAAATANLLIIGDWLEPGPPPEASDELQKFISVGGNVLMLHPGGSLAKLFPGRIKGFTGKEGEIVTMHVPESSVFSGIGPLDLAWFERGGRRVPIACTGVYHLAGRQDTTALASQLDIHGYLGAPSDVNKMGGCPLVEIRLGKGRLIASELCLESGSDDPIARRMLMNLIVCLCPRLN